MAVMGADELAPRSHVVELRDGLSRHYRDPRFHFCESMGELVYASLELLPRV
jgi:hypothetical protein